MHDYNDPSTLGGYPAVRTPASGGGSTAATVGLIACVLYVIGLFVPYYTGGGQSASLSDGGNEVYAIFLFPAVVGIVAALKAKSSGSATAAGVAAGAAIGMFGITQFFIAFSYRFVDSFSEFSEVSYGVGFYLHGGAVVLALVAVLMGLSLPRTELDERRPLNPALCVIGGIAFIGAGAAILLPEDGVSILDIEDGVLKASAIAWAVVSPAVGLFAAVSKVRARVGLAAGIAVGHLGMVLGMAMQNANEGSGIGAGFNVSNEGLYNISVIVSALLVGVALLMNAQEGGSVMTGTLGTVGYAGASASGATASPPQWATDPFGRHQMRYFDGRQWTASVSDNGAVSTDPPVATPAPPTSGFSAPTSGFAAPTSGLAAPTSGLTTPTSGLGSPAASPFDTPSPGAAAAAAPAPAGKQCYMGHENVSSSLYCTTCGARLND